MSQSILFSRFNFKDFSIKNRILMEKRVILIITFLNAEK